MNRMDEIEQYYQEKRSSMSQPGQILLGATLQDFVECYPRSGKVLLEEMDRELTNVKLGSL